MLTMLEPKTFPMDTPTFSGFNTEKMATKSSGRDVEKATRMKPIVVFPNPVTLAKLTELLIVRLLDLIRTINAIIRIIIFPIIPNCSITFSKTSSKL